MLSFSQQSAAHDISQSQAKIEIEGTHAFVLLRINLLEVDELKVKDVVTFEEFDRYLPLIFSKVKQHYKVLSSDASPVGITLEQYDVVENHIAELHMIYSFQHEIKKVGVHSDLNQITKAEHQHLVSVRIGSIVHESVLDAHHTDVTVTVGIAGYLQTIWSFVRLGIEHIFTGYDHLAFLVGLLVVTDSLSSLIRVITSFTIAHSVTLILATANLVILPSRITESLIPLTIAYVAIENLMNKRAIERYQVTFLFGLIHGFGFSNVLRAMQLPARHLALTLFSFNLGVEIGQIAFVLIQFPVFRFLASLRFQTKVRPLISWLNLALATWWFVQRAFLI